MRRKKKHFLAFHGVKLQFKPKRRENALNKNSEITSRFEFIEKHFIELSTFRDSSATLCKFTVVLNLHFSCFPETFWVYTIYWCWGVILPSNATIVLYVEQKITFTYLRTLMWKSVAEHHAHRQEMSLGGWTILLGALISLTLNVNSSHFLFI